MILIGDGLTMRDAGASDHDQLVALLSEWPVNRVRNPDRRALQMVAQNEVAPADRRLTPESGFLLNRVGEEGGKLVCLEALQFIGHTCFVLNHLVLQEHRGKRTYDRMTKISQTMLFEHMGTEGCMFEVPDWSTAVASRVQRDGFSVFREEVREGGVKVAVCGYDADLYRETLRPAIEFDVTHVAG